MIGKIGGRGETGMKQRKGGGKLERPHLVKPMVLHFGRCSVGTGNGMVGTCGVSRSLKHVSQVGKIWHCAQRYRSGSSKGAAENRLCFHNSSCVEISE